MAENETQETTEETTEAVEVQATETEEAPAEVAAEETTEAVTEEVIEEVEEEISYHAVEKEGEITAIWEMQGPKHIRTISPRSSEGEKILNLFTSEIHETDAPPMAAEASSE